MLTRKETHTPMKKFILVLVAATAVAAPLAIAASANAATVSTAPDCKPVIAHTEYKWVPDVTSAGPTQWTTYNVAANTKVTFAWKGADVAYHRDGTKSQFIDGVTCAVQAPVFSNDGKCTVTVPYTPGIDTKLYGVPGYPETDAITAGVTVTGPNTNDGVTVDQFWIGYTAQPGYVITNPGAGTWHIDFNAPACTA
jgi:hypothetical protein